uniref:Ig-like domain-containing protein n=1 Tax=Salvator merianae TaxID=96440 RepID=A0A8D0BBK4_SALMN
MQPKGDNFISDLLEPASPEVTAFYTSEVEGFKRLVCFANNFYPKNIDIQWSVKGHKLNCSTDSSTLVSLANGRFQRTCSSILSEEEWSKAGICTCTVNHSSIHTLIRKDLQSPESVGGCILKFYIKVIIKEVFVSSLVGIFYPNAMGRSFTPYTDPHGQLTQQSYF